MGGFASKTYNDEQGGNDNEKSEKKVLTGGNKQTQHGKKRRKTKPGKVLECSWHSLPREVQGLVLSFLDDEERCAIIPRVSREMRAVHREYPPCRQQWLIEQRVTRPMVDWFRGVAPCLQRLRVYVEGPGVPGLLPEMLATAGRRAPQLRHLHVSGVWDSGAILRGLSSLSGLTELSLETWEFPANGDTHEMRSLSGLKSLQILDLQWLHVNDATSRQLAALWTALAKLKDLNTVKIHICADCGVENLPFFFANVSLLTQIRVFSVTNVFACLDGEWELPGLERLTQLTSLEILDTGAGIPIQAVNPIVAALPCLERLSLQVSDEGVTSFPLASRVLTSLSIRGGGATSVAQLLPPSTPALGSLKSLELTEMPSLTELPAAVADALRHLTSLNLSSTCFNYIPSAVTRIPGLESLDLTACPLRLVACDVGILEGLPRLRILGLSRGVQSNEASGFSQSGVGVLVEIARRWPHLQLHGFC